ncbi:MAG: T9SS type A sorting domain-containing protein [Bacteroidetes bacterium]|nr:T9SS type A sorting domain-containing protein [Bacteroidota bacterium]
MIKRFLLIASSIAAYGVSHAQITINESDVASVGLTVQNSTSSNILVAAPGGANKTWTFNNLNKSSTDTMKFGAAGWYPGASNFSGATMAIDNGDSSYTFLKKNSSALALMGNYDIFNGVGTPTLLNWKLLTFPATYNTSFKDTTVFAQDPQAFGFDVDGGGPLPTIDSIRVILNLHTNSLVDGWGSLTTPLGTFSSLRVNHMRTNTLTAKVQVSGFWIDAPQAFMDSVFSTSGDTVYQHFYWTNNSAYGFPLLTYSYNSGNDTATDVSWLSGTPQMDAVKDISNFNKILVYPNPSSQFVALQFPFVNGTLQIQDVTGKTILVKPIHGNTALDVSTWQKGIYMIRATSENGMLSTSKFQKN